MGRPFRYTSPKELGELSEEYEYKVQDLQEMLEKLNAGVEKAEDLLLNGSRYEEAYRTLVSVRDETEKELNYAQEILDEINAEYENRGEEY